MVYDWNLEEAINLTSLGVNVNIQVPWSCGQTRNRLDIGCQGVTALSAKSLARKWDQ